MTIDTPPKHARLILNNITNSRKTLARIIRWYFAGEIAAEKYRNLVYGISNLLNAFKLESGLEIEKRIERIEELLED